MQLFARNGSEQPKAAPIPIPPRPPAPRRTLSETAALVQQDVEDLTRERDRLMDRVADLERECHRAHDETDTVRKITGGHIEKLEAENARLRVECDARRDAW